MIRNPYRQQTPHAQRPSCTNEPYHHTPSQVNYQTQQHIRQPTNLPADHLNESHGDSLSQLSSNHLRLYSQNINGLKISQNSTDLTYLCETMKQTEASICCFQEINVDTHHHTVKSYLRSVPRKTWPSFKTISASSSVQYGSIYKPGGVTTFIANDLVGRVIDTDSDSLGRWTITNLACRNNQTLSIINIYQVVHDNAATTGDKTAYAQQWSLLSLEEEDPDPRAHFMRDLETLIKTLQSSENLIIIAGDFNDHLEAGTPLSSLISRLSLVDVMTSEHGPPNLATYSRGSTVVDHIIASPEVLPFIVSSGIEPFNSRLFSDHRGLFLDLNTAILFGPLSPLQPPSSRDINSKTLVDNPKYVTTLNKYFEDHRIFERIAAMTNSPYNFEQIEALDRDITRGMLHAGSKCKRGQQFPWSPKLLQAQLTVQILKRHLTSLLLPIDQHLSISTLCDKLGTNIELPATIAATKKSLKQAYHKQSKVLQRADVHRKSFLEEQRKILALKGLKQNTKQLNRLIKAEEVKTMYSKLRAIRPKHSTGLSRVEVPLDPLENPKTATKWRSVDEPHAMEKAIQSRNQTHFGQAKSTIFANPPLNQDFDFPASTDDSTSLLQGEYATEDLTELQEKMIESLEALVPLDQIPSTITFQEMLDKYASWDERTSTSPSGRHLGHYHALLKSYKPDSLDEKEKEISHMAIEILQAHHFMTNYALRHGHSYTRWQKVVTTMIEKDPGNPKIHRLRVIHLYECDYNLLLGIKWRKLVHLAEDLKLLNKGQYGSRPGRTAHDPVIIEELQFEICRLSRTNLLKLAKDATSCFDRIIPNLASIVSRKYGLHRSVVYVHGKTLQEAKYHLKTQLGVSESFYEHSTLFPVYGTGQGSGSSPTIWLVISSTLFDIYESCTPGAEYSSPDGSVQIRIFMLGFVDDCSSQTHNTLQNLDPTTMINNMKRDAQIWGDLLYISGGDLELPKCSYHLINYLFAANGTPYMESGTPGPRLVIQNAARTDTIEIKQVPVQESYKTLGYHKEPAGTETHQIAVLTAKSDDYAKLIRASSVTHTEAWTFYHAIYLTSVGYPTTATHISDQDFLKIQGKATTAVLQKMGYSSTTAHAIVFGPQFFGGLSFRYLSVEQGIQQIQTIVKHWRSDSQITSLLNIALAWYQDQLGVGQKVLEHPSIDYPHDESKWFRQTRRFLHSIGGTIIIQDAPLMQLQRHHDEFLMDRICKSNHFTTPEIKIINYCRLYLRVTLISDLATASGTTLIPGVFTGSPVGMSKPKRMYSIQHRPGKPQWVLWAKALRLWSYPNGTLLVPLGQWKLPHAQLTRQWPSYKDPVSRKLYQYTGYFQYSCHSALTSLFHTNRYSPTSEGTITDLPPQSHPVDALLCGNHHYMISQSTAPPQPPTKPPVTTFHSFISLLPKWERQLLQYVTFDDDPFTTATLLHEQPTYAATDGGAASHVGSFGWRLSTDEGRRLASAMGPVPGDNPHSYRAECYGLLAFLVFTIRLSQYTLVSNPLSVAIHTDSQSMLDTISYEQSQCTYSPNHTLSPDWDVINEILAHLPAVHHTLHYVPSHQDKNISFPNLSLAAQLNVEADRLATTYLLGASPHPVVTPLQNCPSYFLLNGVTITGHYKRAIRFAASGDALSTHLCNKYEWSDETFLQVDWSSHSKAIGHFIQNKTSIIKLIHGILPTNKRLHRYQTAHPHHCPTCFEPQEDTHHLFICHHITRATWRTTFIDRLYDHLDHTKTKPNLAHMLAQTFVKIFDTNQDPSTTFTYPYSYLKQSQTAIGWDQMLYGRFSIEWKRLQLRFLKSTGIQHPHAKADKWQRDLIIFIFQEFHLLWEMRNQDKHGPDQSQKAILLKERARRELTELYTYRNQILPGHQKIYRESLDNHLQESTRSILNWITTYTPVIASSRKKAKARSISFTRPINTYFPLAQVDTTPPPNHRSPPLYHHGHPGDRQVYHYQHSPVLHTQPK
jgi:exonuclease III